MVNRVLSIIFVSMLLVSSMVIINSTTYTAKASSGNILYVGGSGPGNYTYIQDAVDDAVDGDTVFVYSDVYYENVVISKTISLIGEDKNTTIIDGNGTGDVVNITSDGIKLQGFTIRHSDYYLPSHYCGGIKVYHSNGNILSNCTISNNWCGILFINSSNNDLYPHTFPFF